MLSSFQNAYNVLTKDQQTVLYKTMQNRMMQHDPDEDEE
jgi:hypothetical protein